MKYEIIKVKDFSGVLGGRFRVGPNSGEEFRYDYLLPLLMDGGIGHLVVNLDGTFGYPSSFLDEAFGVLGKLLPSKWLKGRMSFISTEEPSLPERIWEYVDKHESETRWITRGWTI